MNQKGLGRALVLLQTESLRITKQGAGWVTQKKSEKENFTRGHGGEKRPRKKTKKQGRGRWWGSKNSRKVGRQGNAL